MADIAIQIVNTVISFVPWMIAAIIILAVVAFLARRKGKKEEDFERPPIIEPEDKILDQYKKLTRNFGQSLGYKSYLKFGPMRTSRVMRWMPFYIPIEPEQTKKGAK